MDRSASIARSATALAVAVLAVTPLAGAFDSEKLAPQAKVSIVRARALAIQVVPGKIVAEELEKESGGSGLRYTFDIKTAKGIREVGIDAKTGKVVQNIAERDEPAGR